MRYATEIPDQELGSASVESIDGMLGYLLGLETPVTDERAADVLSHAAEEYRASSFEAVDSLRLSVLKMMVDLQTAVDLERIAGIVARDGIAAARTKLASFHAPGAEEGELDIPWGKSIPEQYVLPLDKAMLVGSLRGSLRRAAAVFLFPGTEGDDQRFREDMTNRLIEVSGGEV